VNIPLLSLCPVVIALFNTCIVKTFPPAVTVSQKQDKSGRCVVSLVCEN